MPLEVSVSKVVVTTTTKKVVLTYEDVSELIRMWAENYGLGPNANVYFDISGGFLREVAVESVDKVTKCEE